MQTEFRNIQKRLDDLWDKPGHSKLDWLELEQLLRDILCAARHKKAIQNGRNENVDYLMAIDEAIAAFTRRGYTYRNMLDPNDPDAGMVDTGLANML
jgi:hypothetical protein